MTTDKPSFWFHVDLTAFYADTSRFSANGHAYKPLPEQKDPHDTDAIVSLAATHAEILVQTVLNAKTKTEPQTYMVPISVHATYPDKRQADRSEQLSISDPNEVVPMVREWFQRNLKELVDIGSDEI